MVWCYRQRGDADVFMSLPVVLVIGGISAVLYLYGANEQGGYVPLVIFLLVAFVGYIASLFLHPRRACWSCRGKGRHTGLVWAYGNRRCTNCDGTGRRPRWGTKFFSGIDAS